MEQIAADAKVGVATLYKYFGTKENIAREVFFPDMERVFERGEEIVADPPNEPLEAMIMLLRCYMSLGNGWEDKRVLRLFTVPSSLENQPAFAEVIGYSDQRATEQIQRLLSKFQDEGSIPDDVRTAEIGEIIFYIMNEQFMKCVLSDDVRASEAFEKIEMLVRAIFLLWSDRQVDVGSPARAHGKAVSSRKAVKSQ